MSNIIQIKHGISNPTPQILQPYELGYKEKEGLYINDDGVVRPVWGQSDYGQNDPAAADFIKNRTHHVVTKTESVVSDKLFFSNYGSQRNEKFVLKTNSKYRVIFDGEEYECVAFDTNINDETFQAIGNTYLMNGGPSLTNEPFLFLYKEGLSYNFMYFLLDLNIEHIATVYLIEENNSSILFQNKVLFLDSMVISDKIIKTKFDTQTEVQNESYQIYFNEKEFNLLPTDIEEDNFMMPVPYVIIGNYDKQQYLENGIPIGIVSYLGFNEAFTNIVVWNAQQPGWYDIKVYRTYSFLKTIDPQYLPKEGVGYSKFEKISEDFDLVEIINELIKNNSNYEYVIKEEEHSGKKIIYGNFQVSTPPFEISPNEAYEISINGKTYKTGSVIIEDYKRKVCVFGDLLCDFLSLYDDMHIIVGYEKRPDEINFSLIIDMEYFNLEDFPAEILVKKIYQKENIYQINDKYIPSNSPNWNENDPTSKGYIENRTHWVETIMDTNTAPEEAKLVNGSGYGPNTCSWDDVEQPNLVVGETYVVIVGDYNSNYKEYTCVCVESVGESAEENVILLGNIDIYNYYDPEETDEPFCIYIKDENDYGIIANNEIVSISIYHTIEKVHKLDKKFLPEGSGNNSGVTSWNDLEDKPFYEEWDHIVINKSEDNESFLTTIKGIPITFYKLSNLKPTKEELIGCIITSEDGEIGEVAENHFAPEDTLTGMIAFEPGIYVVYNPKVTVKDTSTSIYTITFPSTGIWIVFPAYDDFATLEYDGQIIYPLDEKFIPNSIARKSDIGWTDLVDKPFDTPLEIKWDLNTPAIETITQQEFQCYKISEYAPTLGDFAGGIFEGTYIDSSGTSRKEKFTVPEMNSLEWEEGLAIMQEFWGESWWSLGEALVVVTDEQAMIDTDLILSKGVWICSGDYIELTLSGKYGHIYEDFIPDSIARVGDNPFYPPKVYEYKWGEGYQEIVEYEDGWGDKYYLIKVSNDAPNFQKFVGGNFYIEVNTLFDTSQLEEGENTTDLPPGVTSGSFRMHANVDFQEESFRFEDGFYTPGGYVIVVTKSKVDVDGIELTKGIWFLDILKLTSGSETPDSQPGVKEFNYSIGATIPPKTISEDLIPETIARISQVPKNWDELPGKPFGTAQYRFDANNILEEKEYTSTEGNSTVKFSYYKYSNYVNPAKDFIGSRIISKHIEDNGQSSFAIEESFEISDQTIIQQDGYFTILESSIGVEKEEITLDNGIILSKGMWYVISGTPTSEFYFDKPLYFKPISDRYLPLNTPQVEKASVGQVVVIKSVDKNGKPIAWEAIDPWVVQSSTAGSNKKFRLSIDDSGAITATEIS